MSMFRSAADVSSSDPESSSEEENNNYNLPGIHVDVNKPTHVSASLDELLLEDYGIPTPSRVGPENVLEGALDLDADGHASVMTSALLEFFCLSRAADTLNAQPGSYGRFTRESLEVKQLAKQMFRYNSQFLSKHGIVAGGIEDDEWEKIRQYYRDNLDMLGNAAVGDTSARHSSGRHGETSNITRDTLATQSLIPTPKYYQASIGPGPSSNNEWNIQKRNPVSLGFHGHSEGFLNLNNLLRAPQLPSGDKMGSMALVSTKIEHPLDRTSRYTSEFLEVKLLGRGSFGHVFEAKHHVDGQSYAVKKIPLSKWRLDKLQQEGLQHLEDILKEIRTLARLEHENVVRYFGAWVEERHVYRECEALGQEDMHMKMESSKQDDPAEEEESFGVVFGLSSNDGEDDDNKHDDYINKSDFHDQKVGPWSNSHQRRDSRFTNASSPSRSITYSSGDEDEDVESIQRNFSIPDTGVLSHDYTSTWDPTDTDIFTNDMSDDQSKLQLTHQDKSQSQAVVLHIQMSLHPLNLSTLLNPRRGHYNNIGRPSLVRHCFHILPSIKLLLGILSGVEYLHSKGIVHRDLKPANIFLSTREDDKDICHSCHGTNSEHTACLYRPRIGDFGLVADISHCTELQASDGVVVTQKMTDFRTPRHVGTEFYCPPKLQYTSCPEPGNYIINEKLDVFALGVILFELLYPLNTKMERQLVLSELTRRGPHDGTVIIPHDFEDKIDCGRVKLANGMSVAESVSTCIKGMLEPDSQRRWDCKDVRMSLQEIVFLIHRDPFLRN